MVTRYSPEFEVSPPFEVGDRCFLRILTPEQVRHIDKAISDSGSDAEIRLVKLKGKLRFVETLEKVQLVEPG